MVKRYINVLKINGVSNDLGLKNETSRMPGI